MTLVETARQPPVPLVIDLRYPQRAGGLGHVIHAPKRPPAALKAEAGGRGVGSGR